MTESRKAALIKYLARDGLDTLECFRSLPPGAWSATAGDGSPPRLLLSACLIDEQSLHYFISNILLGSEGMPAGFDLDTFRDRLRQGMHNRKPDELLDALAKARVTTIEIVQKMTDADLQREGVHPEHGRMQIDAILTQAINGGETYRAAIAQRQCGQDNTQHNQAIT